MKLQDIAYPDYDGIIRDIRWRKGLIKDQGPVVE
jgi:hypothetical protein